MTYNCPACKTDIPDEDVMDAPVVVPESGGIRMAYFHLVPVKNPGPEDNDREPHEVNRS
jgi:hypothetical protein